VKPPDFFTQRQVRIRFSFSSGDYALLYDLRAAFGSLRACVWTSKYKPYVSYPWFISYPLDFYVSGILKAFHQRLLTRRTPQLI
jgi:hypothetical protein